MVQKDGVDPYVFLFLVARRKVETGLENRCAEYYSHPPAASPSFAAITGNSQHPVAFHGGLSEI